MNRRHLLTLPAALFAQKAPLGERIAQVRQFVVAEMAKRKIPGLAIAIADRERVLWEDGLGSADLENGLPVKPSSKFRLASISKPITAVAVLQLVEQKKIGLDTDIREYVKAFPAKPHKVTVRQLLGHLGGVRHYKGAEIASTRHYNDVVTPLEIFANDDLAHPPGSAYLYTTYGYNVLGAAVQQASGLPYVEYVRQNILAPVALHGIVPDDQFAIVEDRVRGYQRRQDGSVTHAILADTSNKIPGGGWLGTASAVARFSVAFRQGKFTSKETVALMLRSQTTSEGKPAKYGMGWQHFHYGNDRVADDKKLIGHGGSQPGTNTIVVTTTDDSWTVCLLTNLEGAQPLSIAEGVVPRMMA